MNKLLPKTIRDRVAIAIAKHNLTVDHASKMVRESQAKRDKIIGDLRNRCPHENVSACAGTPYDLGSQVCDDCRMEL